MSLHQCRRFRGNTVEYRSAFTFSQAFAGDAFLFGLDRFPVAQHLGGVASLRLTEDMRMSPHHLCVNFVDYVVNVKFAAFFRDTRKECDLEKQIAEFLTQSARPAFARFFERVE